MEKLSNASESNQQSSESDFASLEVMAGKFETQKKRLQFRERAKKALNSLLNYFSNKKSNTLDTVVEKPTVDMHESAETEQPSEAQIEQARQAERERIEQERFEQEFFNKMDQVRAQKNKGYEQERIQELAERAFNQQLTSMEEIEAVANSDATSIIKREIPYGDKTVTVYDLHGYPISFLQHKLDFKKDHTLGSSTATKLQGDPSLWSKKRNEHTGFGGESIDAVSDAISTSYIDTYAANSSAIFSAPNRLVYGFNHTPADSLLCVSYGDGVTSNAAGQNRHSELWLKMDGSTPDYLNTPPAQGTVGYNEVQLRRYDEKGNPLLPDFMIVIDGQISDATLRHAAHFNIPIINLVREDYKQQSEQRFNSMIDGLDENSDYETIRRTLDEVAASPFAAGDNRQNTLGAWGPDDKPAEHYAPVNPDKLQKLRDLELKKRMEYIKKTLSEAIAKMESGGIPNYKLRVKHAQYGVARYAGEFMNELRIDVPIHNFFTLETVIYDGGHPSPDNYRTYPGANSVYYDELAPLVNRYLSLIH